MSQLKLLRSATTLHEVASLLGFKASALSYILYVKDPGSKYSTFEIPKRHGGARTVSAPAPELKLLQRRLATLLQNCVEEINSFNNFSDQLAHGFKRKRSIISNATKHRHRRYVFNVDLKDFFGTINFGRVRGFFIKDENFSLSPSAATILAQIVCHKNSLPQGSPCSPVISNLIGHVLDTHLVRLALRNGCVYSRYADDISFSTNQKNFPPSISTRSVDSPHQWIAGSELVRLVKHSGFALNDSKTRMQYKDSRQEVTGLVVNRKVNVSPNYRKVVRAMVHRLFTTGAFEFSFKSITANGEPTIRKYAGKVGQLRGMLAFIDQIDLHNKNLHKRSFDQSKQKEKLQLTTKELMYRRFLLYQEFYAAQRPVIVCEGKTDNIYLVHAIRSLVGTFPQLATKKPDGSISLAVRILKYTDSSTGRILGIASGGSPCLANLVHTYKSELGRFSAPGNKFPVIMLIDNDSGAGSVFSAIRQITRKNPTRTEPFIHVVGNLYVVPTPLIRDKNESTIEDFFDDATKAIKVAGKSFSLSGDTDNEHHFGKAIFAHKVVAPFAGSINFNGFHELLSRLTAVINEHQKLFE